MWDLKHQDQVVAEWMSPVPSWHWTDCYFRRGRLVSAAKAGVTGKQDNFYREQLNKHLYRDTVHRNPRDIERSASGTPDIRYKTCKIDSEYFNSYIFAQGDIHMWGVSRSQPPCLALSVSDLAIVGYLWRVPRSAPWPRSSFLDVGDGHLLATRGAD